ncbi:MAG TPA: hypothetical protein VML93_10635, partial [Mycobacterium sp.]
MDDDALHLLLQPIPEQSARLRFQWQFGQFGDHVFVGTAEKISGSVHLVDLRVGASHGDEEGEPRAGGHEVAHCHRAVQRHKPGVLEHLQVGELANERRYGVVELPLALFVEGHHGGVAPLRFLLAAAMLTALLTSAASAVVENVRAKIIRESSPGLRSNTPYRDGPDARCRGRTGARCRHFCRSVSPARPPNP